MCWLPMQFKYELKVKVPPTVHSIYTHRYVVKMKVLAVGLRVCLYDDHYTTANWLFIWH